MTNVISIEQEAVALVTSFRVLEVLRAEGITETSAQAMILMSIRTNGSQHPSGVTPSDIAHSLNMTISAVARLMAKLAEPDGGAFLMGARAIPGSRAEAFVLTLKGREFVEKFVNAYHGGKPRIANRHDLKSFAKAQVSTRPLRQLRKANWDEDNLTLVVSPVEGFLADEVQRWIGDFLSEKPTILEVTKEGACLKFANYADGVHFVLRWC